MLISLAAGDDRGLRAVGDLLHDLSFVSATPVDFTVRRSPIWAHAHPAQSSTVRYDALVVPCLSAFGIGGHVADRLLVVLGPVFGHALASEIDNRFAGEQTKGAPCVEQFRMEPALFSLLMRERPAVLCVRTRWMHHHVALPVLLQSAPLYSHPTQMHTLFCCLRSLQALRS